VWATHSAEKRRVVTLSIWRRGAFGHLLIAMLPSWLSWSASLAVIGWLAFAATKAPGIVGLVFAVRLAPLVLLGVPVGTLSDRFGRVRILQASNLVSAAIFLGLAVLVMWTTPSIVVLLSVSIGLGLADAGRMVCGNNLVFEFAGELGPTRAFALSNFVAAIGQIAGGAIAGVALSTAGPDLAAALIASGSAATALLLIGITDRPRSGPVEFPSFTAGLRDGLALLLRVPTVGLLIVVALVVEMFAFSCVTLDPVFAGQVFLVGPAGLGLIIAARSLGRLVGSGALAVVPPRRSVGRTLSLAILGFGLALVAYSQAPGLVVALPLVLGAGIASVLVDALVLAALQASVDAESRGRAAGLWVLMIGLQPIGVLEVGFVAQIAGARFSQGLNGAMVLAFGIVLLATSVGRRLKNIGTIGQPVAESRE
jgi:MFS family permease